MKVKIGEKTFVFERTLPATNRFNIMEVRGGKRDYAGDGIFLFYEDKIRLRNIEIKPKYRGTLGAVLIKNAFRFLAKTFPGRKVLTYTRVVRGKAPRDVRIKLTQFRRTRRGK